MLPAVFVNRLAGHKFHHDEWNAFPGQARIQKSCDIGVFQACEDSPLMLESPHHARAVKGRIDQFYGYLFFKLLVIATAKVHHPHAATANDADEPVLAGARSLETSGHPFD